MCAVFVERTRAVAIRPVVAGDLDLRHVVFAGEHGVARAANVALKHDQRVLSHLATLVGTRIGSA